MQFSEAALSGVYLIELETAEDERGSFARSFCVDEFEEAGIEFSIVQANISFNNFAGTLRGMHFQGHPHGESKIVRCTRGAIFDVALDLRAESETFCQWHGVELNAENRKALLIPQGCAHGFQTLSKSTEVHYLMSERYMPETADGVRFDDPAFRIDWPKTVSSISARDRSWPDFQRQK